MAIITFMSDFGTADHYVAAVKAKILTIEDDIKIIDISHSIPPFDIGSAAFVLGAVFRDFPKGTVHLVAVSGVPTKSEPLVALSLEDHFFLGRDTGIFNLITEEPIAKAVLLNLDENSAFPEKDILVPAAVKLAKGKSLDKLGSPYSDPLKMMNRQAKATRRQIHGQVVYIDVYGNLITNIKKKDFDAIMTINNNGKFQIRVGKERLNTIHKYYNDAESGDIYLFFNSLGVLQVGINKGNANELLGLGFDSAILIDFEQPN